MFTGYRVNHDDRFTITLWGKSADFKNIIGNKILENVFTQAPARCVMRENNTLKIINTPDFLDEECQYPDQHIIDCMALSYPGPNLFILAIDSENSQEKEVMDQIRELQNIFGEDIIAHLVVMLPTTQIFHSLHHLKKHFKIQLEPMSDKLNSDWKKWCSGRKSFRYNYKNYSEEVVRRRKSVLEKRR